MTKIDALKEIVELKCLVWDLHNGHRPTDVELQKHKCNLSQLQEWARKMPDDEVSE
jgi:hypothetical protein